MGMAPAVLWIPEAAAAAVAALIVVLTYNPRVISKSLYIFLVNIS